MGGMRRSGRMKRRCRVAYADSYNNKLFAINTLSTWSP